MPSATFDEVLAERLADFIGGCTRGEYSNYGLATDILAELGKEYAIVPLAESTTFYIQSDKDPSVWVCSKCEIEWQFPKGNPDENSMEFCPGCGRQIANVIGYAPFAKKEATPHV